MVAVLTFAGLHGHAGMAAQVILSWDAFALVMVVLAWVVICTKDPYEVRRNVSLQDASATFLFGAVIFAALASLLAVGILLESGKDHAATGRVAGRLALSVAAVGLSWFLVDTLFSLRYAHAFFKDAHKQAREKVQGGLEFPGKGSPDYMDFAYFSFVVGMTCQVSDVQISSRTIRRLALVHGLISFAFNTAILAMFVNIIAGLV